MQVVDVKKKIEQVQGADVYPAAQQMLIHQGKILKDGTTLAENRVIDNNFIVVMLSKVFFMESWALGFPNLNGWDIFVNGLKLSAFVSWYMVRLRLQGKDQTHLLQLQPR